MLVKVSSAKPKQMSKQIIDSDEYESDSDMMSTQSAWRCEGCDEEFNDEHEMILECELGSLHFCSACLKFSDEEYKFLTIREDMHWFCPSCEGKALVSIRVDSDVATQCDEYLASACGGED